MQHLLEADARVTAVFAVNDPTAIGAMRAIWERGLRIPEDVAVVGAGPIKHGDLLKVPLTTVSWSTLELGRRAAELLLKQIEAVEPHNAQRVVLEPQLIVRRSCGSIAQVDDLLS